MTPRPEEARDEADDDELTVGIELVERTLESEFDEVELVREVKEERDLSTDELRRVMISRNVGRMVGSSCQHVFISSTNSLASSLTSCGIAGRSPLRITATATAAGLMPG